MGIISFILTIQSFTINYLTFSDFFIRKLLLDHRSEIKIDQILKEK